MTVDPFRIIAHRGASAYAPENTMAAFHKAVEMGVSEVETDVGFTKDGKLLLFHDRALERTTNGAGVPSAYTLSELKELDAGSWMDPKEYPDFRWDEDFAGERLITLEELFEAYGEALTYHVEIKDRAQGIVGAIVDCVHNFDLTDNVFIAIGGDEEYLSEAKRLEPNIRTELAPGRQISENGPQALETIAQAGHDMVTLNASNQSRELVELAHSLGMEVRSSGIRNKEQMAEAVEIGCNGMTINWPDWLIDYMANRG